MLPPFCMKMHIFLPNEELFVFLQKIKNMKPLKAILLLIAALSLTNIAHSQQTLIMELQTNRNDEILSEIRSRTEVLSVFPIAIEKNILFSDDTLIKIELSNNEFYITKKYVNYRDVNSFSFLWN